MTFARSFFVSEATLRQRIRERLFPTPFKIIQERMLELLPEHLHAAAMALPASLKRFEIRRDEAVMYYPGCGQDIVWPLLALDGIAGQARRWTIIAQDPADTIGALISGMQQITGQETFSMKISGNGAEALARFRFKDRQIDIIFHSSDALERTPPPLESGYDIYIERGFQIMRDQRPDFIEEALKRLRPGGIALTDYGFFGRVRDARKSKVKLPAWGFYKTPAAYIKTDQTPPTR